MYIIQFQVLSSKLKLKEENDEGNKVSSLHFCQHEELLVELYFMYHQHTSTFGNEGVRENREKPWTARCLKEKWFIEVEVDIFYLLWKHARTTLIYQNVQENEATGAFLMA